MLFLTQGTNSRYDDYRDPRCWSIPSAANFASLAQILGVNAIAEELIRDPLLASLFINFNIK